MAERGPIADTALGERVEGWLAFVPQVICGESGVALTLPTALQEPHGLSGRFPGKAAPPGRDGCAQPSARVAFSACARAPALAKSPA